MHTVTVCTICDEKSAKAGKHLPLGKNAQGWGVVRELEERLQEYPELQANFKIQRAACTGAGCSNPTALAVRGTNKIAWIFNKIQKEDIDDVIEFMQKYMKSKDGQFKIDDRPNALKEVYVKLPATE